MLEAMEEIQTRHRKEQRDLQSRITQKKKQASKKTRKGVNDECERLEAELKAKQVAEIAAFNGERTDQDSELPQAQLEELTLTNGQEERRVSNGVEKTPAADAADWSPDGPVVPSQGRKPNRQKARLARRVAEQEEAVQKAAEEAQSLPDLKQQEHERMLAYMKERGLQEKEIPADGHCLYSAVADQLEQLQIPLGFMPGSKPVVGYKAVRAAAADYIEKHQDDFVPFVEEPLPQYLHKIRETGEWGGQLELMALAKTYGIDINVLQDFGRVEKIVSGISADKAAWLGYYKHGFGLGEHYNSLRKPG